MGASSRITSASLLALLTCLYGETFGDEPSRFRMEGTVTEADTNRPIAGATVQVLIESERRLDQKIRSATTDASGRYSVALPVGHGWTWNLLPPPGYFPVASSDLEHFATTADQPIFKKDYQVRKGMAWSVRIRVPAEALPLSKTYFSKTYFSLGQKRQDNYFSAFCEVDQDGSGSVTIPSDAAGEFTITCGDIGRMLAAPDDLRLVIGEGFRSDRVESCQLSLDESYELRDRAGRIATLRGARAEIMDGAASIVVLMKLRAAADRGQLIGRILDTQNQPLAGATVEAAFHGGGGSATTSLTATSAADGSFRLAIPKSSDVTRVSLVVTREGYAGIDTEPRSIDFSQSQEADFGSIKLRPGCSIRVRVVSPGGQPLVGAIVEPLHSYAARAQIGRTDAAGVCMLKNLEAGVAAVSARFGTLTASTKLPLAEGDNELIVLKLTAPRDQAVKAPAPVPPRKDLSPGTAAPEWTIAQWTDGNTRKLADYRGKVVVLDFWGIWCGPCVRSIPAMKQLHERYQNQDVVFFGIHTAGTDMSLVQRLLQQQNWHTVTGLDTGDDIISGASVQAFAVHGFPTVMVIGRQGKIAFNSSYLGEDRDETIKRFMKQMEEDAKTLGLPWPLDQDATPEQITERLNTLQVLHLSREIDRALLEK